MDLFDNPVFLGERGLIRMDRGICLAVEAQDRDEIGYCDALYECICSVARVQETVHIDDILHRFSRRPDHPNANAGSWRRAKTTGSFFRPACRGAAASMPARTLTFTPFTKV